MLFLQKYGVIAGCLVAIAAMFIMFGFVHQPGETAPQTISAPAAWQGRVLSVVKTEIMTSTETKVYHDAYCVVGTKTRFTLPFPEEGHLMRHEVSFTAMIGEGCDEGSGIISHEDYTELIEIAREQKMLAKK